MSIEPRILDMRELLTGVTRNLAHVQRFAGLRVNRRESVSEHTCFTMMISWFIARQCEILGSRRIDYGKLLSRGLFHDFDEAIMVDLPRPVKYANEALRAQWQVMCRESVMDMGKRLGVPFFDAWDEAKDDTLEGGILALADLISVTSYLIEEIQMGNSLMIPALALNADYLREYYKKQQCNELRALTMDAFKVAADYIPHKAW